MSAFSKMLVVLAIVALLTRGAAALGLKLVLIPVAAVAWLRAKLSEKTSHTGLIR